MKKDTEAGKIEWARGWRVVLGASLVSGFGVPLFYYVFSIFSTGMIAEYGITRGELANAQAMLIAGALFAPIMGRMLDRFGFRRIYLVCALALIATHLTIAFGPASMPLLFVLIFSYGLFGLGNGPLAYTRPVNAWFFHDRGLALGLSAILLAFTSLIGSPLLVALVEAEGWRTGFLALALVHLAFALPAALLLMPDGPDKTSEPAIEVAPEAPPIASPPNFFFTADFWLLNLSILCVAIAGSGLVSQAAPLVEAEGVSARAAAFGIGAYAAGQLAGRVISGWFLDRSNPRAVAFFFTFLPALGFALLAGFQLPLWAVILAIGAIGVQQGAEIDLFAWFTARRFGVDHYGRVYGWIIAFSWLGNAVGILLFGKLHDAFGNYQLAQWIGCFLLIAGAVLIAQVNVKQIRAQVS